MYALPRPFFYDPEAGAAMHCVAAHCYGINIEDKKTPFEVLYFPPKMEAHNYKNSRKNFKEIE